MRACRRGGAGVSEREVLAHKVLMVACGMSFEHAMNGAAVSSSMQSVATCDSMP